MKNLIETIALAVQRHQTVHGPDYDGIAQAVLAALEAKGLVVVPKEPTEAMLNTEAKMDPGGMGPINDYLDYFSADEIWRAMVAAAIKERA